MNRRKPRGKVPSLIGGSLGRPVQAMVERKSKCYRCYVGLQSGQSWIEIPKLDSAYRSKKRVCFECYDAILNQTEKDLKDLRATVLNLSKAATTMSTE